jgi:plastocyanin
MDKMGMVVAVVIVAIAIGFSMTGGINISDIRENTQPTVEKMKQVADDTKQILDETKTTAEKGVEIVKELTSSKLPARLVSIPTGTSIPGCEGVNLCYDPSTLIIFTGGEVIWRNDDSSAHTVTSGDIINGPDMKFDSGLIKPDQIFSYMFEESGEYRYFCMIHPWANGSVTVK